LTPLDMFADSQSLLSSKIEMRGYLLRTSCSI
jgi:hypothetical protein